MGDQTAAATETIGLPLPFFEDSKSPEEQDKNLLGAFRRNIAPFLARRDVCSPEVYLSFLQHVPKNQWKSLVREDTAWVAVGRLGFLPILGHSDPLRFAKAAPLPQWYAPQVILTKPYHQACLAQLRDHLSKEDAGANPYARPSEWLPDPCPSEKVIASFRDALEWLVQFGVFETEIRDRQIGVLKSILEGLGDEDSAEDRIQEVEDGAETRNFMDGIVSAVKYLRRRQPCVDIRHVAPNPELLKLLPQNLAAQHELVAFAQSARTTFVLSPFPERFHICDLLAQKLGGHREVLMVLVSARHQKAHMNALESLEARNITVADFEGSAEETESVTQINIRRREVAALDINSPNLTNEQILHWVLCQAVVMGASDIHWEQLESSGRVRVRLDGGLVTIYKLELTTLKGLLAVIKNTCGMNPSHLDTDDNRLAIRIDDTVVDVRVSAVPFRNAMQKIVMRLLNKGDNFMVLEDLHLPDRHDRVIRRAIRQKQGLILVTGPTGSGKSTTLYAMLDCMNKPNENIHTIEDPIEYELDGLNQTQINLFRGLTYDRILRALLRQDPDIIMVGEVRDRDTAEAAANAALTGHLVLSTIHSLSAIKSVRRLTQMGVPAYMLAESIILLQAQRLIRRLCECKRSMSPSDKHKQELESKGLSVPREIFVSEGCPACMQTGYKGRLAVMELCPIDDELSDLIAAEASTRELYEAAEAQGFSGLYREALHHVVAGETSFEEASDLDIAW